MINIYKNRAIFLLFGIISVINIILLSVVFFAYSANLKKDYEEKLTSVASQTAANANLILSFFEEEIEIFINKYSVEESLESFQIDAPNFVRVDSTSFEELVIFNGVEPVYATNAEHVEFYREMVLDDKFKNVTKNKISRWLINEEKGKILTSYGTLIYVRSLYDTDTNEKSGCVVAAVSTNQLLKLLNLGSGYQEGKEREFLPHSVGFSIDDKILLLGENTVEKDKVIFKKEDLRTGKNEVYFTNVCDEKEIYTIHNTKMLKDKIFIVLFLFVLLFAVITFSSYKMLAFLLSEICDRIDKLNHEIEMYSPTKEEKTI